MCQCVKCAGGWQWLEHHSLGLFMGGGTLAWLPLTRVLCVSGPRAAHAGMYSNIGFNYGAAAPADDDSSSSSSDDDDDDDGQVG